MKRKIKLLYFILISFSFLAVLVMFLYSFHVNNRFKEMKIEALEDYGTLICRDIAISSADYLFSENYLELEYIVEEFKARSSVEEISIANHNGIIVADTEGELIGKESRHVMDCGAAADMCIKNYGDQELRFVKPVLIQGIEYGKVITIISLKETNEQIKNLVLSTILWSVLFFVLCLFLGSILSKFLTRPVEKLIAGIKNIAGGEYNTLETNQWLYELDELQDTYNYMSAELKSRESQLKSARLEAERASSAKSVFLANISHELRTPLNGITGFSSLLSDTKLTEAQRELLDKIIYSADTFSSIIRNLLDLIELEAGMCTLNNAKFDCEKLVEKLEAAVRIMLGGKAVEYSCDFDERCRVLVGDLERLEQILVLVLTNAAKFTAVGSIRMRVFRDNDVVFEIEDTGIGIAEEKQPEVFEMLHQGEAPLVKKHRGIGAGMPIVKLLVDLMQGEIELESKVGIGTKVTIRLPLSEATEPVCVNPDGDESESNVCSVLLVEDEAINRMYLKMVLEKAGYHVLEASDGKTAVAKYTEEDIDIILMDLGLPGINGIDASVEIIKSMKYKSNPVPIIAVTASTEGEIKNRSREIGMADFVTKPVKEEVLFNAMSTALEKK